MGAEVGLQNTGWADKLSLRIFYGQNDRALQSNVFVTVPYGDLNLGDQATSGILHYQWRGAALPVDVEVLLSYAARTGYVNDITRNIWNWRALITGARVIPGERGNGIRVTTASRPATARVTAGLRLAEHSRIEFNLSPAYTDWLQRNQSVVTSDLPWVQTRYNLLKVVAGASWQLRLLNGQLKNDLFAKYFYADPHGPVTAIVNNAAKPAPSNNWGGGDGLRYAILGPLAGKASYEYATRVPDAQELFGDGLLMASNAALLPEKSHNLNVGLTLERWGHWPWAPRCGGHFLLSAHDQSHLPGGGAGQRPVSKHLRRRQHGRGAGRDLGRFGAVHTVCQRHLFERREPDHRWLLCALLGQPHPQLALSVRQRSCLAQLWVGEAGTRRSARVLARTLCTRLLSLLGERRGPHP